MGIYIYLYSLYEKITVCEYRCMRIEMCIYMSVYWCLNCTNKAGGHFQDQNIWCIKQNQNYSINASPTLPVTLISIDLINNDNNNNKPNRLRPVCPFVQVIACIFLSSFLLTKTELIFKRTHWLYVLSIFGYTSFWNNAVL